MNGFKSLCIHLSPELEVGHGDAGAVDVALAPAPGHPVQPAHVDAAAAPEGAGPDHVVVGLRHPRHVAAVIADRELKLIPILLHPNVGFIAVLRVDQLVPVVCIYCTPTRSMHQTSHDAWWPIP